MLPQHNHLPLSFISRTPRSEGVPSHRGLRQEQQGKSNRFAQITERHSAAKALPPRGKDARRAAPAKDKDGLSIRRDLDFSAEIIFAKSPSVPSNTEATRNRYGEKRTTDSQGMSVPATLLSPELEMDLSKYKSGNSNNLKAERTARSLQCVNHSLCLDLFNPFHRLDAALTDQKKKHDMPVQGWRSVSAVHKAKHEQWSWNYKEQMEKVAREIGIEGGLENLNVTANVEAEHIMLGMVSASEKQKAEAALPKFSSMEWAQAVAKFDADGSGDLDKEEFTNALQTLGLRGVAQGAAACVHLLASKHGFVSKLITSETELREELISGWRNIHFFVFDTTAADFNAWQAIDAVAKHRREFVRSRPAIVIVDSEGLADAQQRRTLEYVISKNRWQRTEKPVYPQAFSVLLNRALERNESRDHQDSEPVSVGHQPNVRPHQRKSVFFTLQKDLHALSDDEDEAGQNQKIDLRFQRILATVTTSMSHDTIRHVASPVLRVFPVETTTTESSKKDRSLFLASAPRESKTSVAGHSLSAKSEVRISSGSQAEMLKHLTQHPTIEERNLAGKENFTSVLREYNSKSKREFITDSDGSLTYIRTCREFGVTPNSRFTDQMNDELLFLRHTPVGPRGGKAIGTSLSLNSRPVHVDLGFCEVGPEGVCALAEGLNKVCFYRSLDLSGNRIGSTGANALASCLTERAKMSHLKRLILGSNHLSDKGAVAVAKILDACLNLDYLDLKCNGISQPGAFALGHALEHHHIDPDLEINFGPKSFASGNNRPVMGTSPADTQLGAAVGNGAAESNNKKTSMPMLTHTVGGLLHLDLSGNDLGDAGTRALCSGLFKNGRLQTLILSHNKIKNEGAKAISEAMIFNDAMTHLDISHNLIRGVGAMDIVRSINIDRKTSFLDVSFNPLSFKAVVEIVNASNKQHPKRLRLLNISNTLETAKRGDKSRMVGDRSFNSTEDLTNYIKESENSLHEIKQSSGVYDEQLHNARLQTARMKVSSEQKRSNALSELQSTASTMSETLVFAKAACMQFEAILDEAKAVLIDWLHEESAVDSRALATEIMLSQNALDLVTGQYDLNLGDPWHYFIFVSVLQTQMEVLGIEVEVEYMRKGWTIPYMHNATDTAFCDGFSIPFFYRRSLAHNSPRLDLDKVPQGGVATVRIAYRGHITEQKYNLDLTVSTDSAMLETLRLRETHFHSGERIIDVKYQGNPIACFSHSKWVMPTVGVMNLTYQMLLFDYDPFDIWGKVTLNLSLPWERIVAASLYEKIRKRAVLRQHLVSSHLVPENIRTPRMPAFVRTQDITASIHSTQSLTEKARPVDELPDWEAKCMLDDREVPFDNMVSVPSFGKLTIEIHHHKNEPRFSQAVVLQLQIPVHRWIAERFWLRCFNLEDDDRASSIKTRGNRTEESIFSAKEYILEFPTFNNLEYQGMHKHAAEVRKGEERREAEAGKMDALAPVNKSSPDNKIPVDRKGGTQLSREESRWIPPACAVDSVSTLSFIFVLQDPRYIRLQQQVFDLENEEERIDADHLFTGDEFLCANQSQINYVQKTIPKSQRVTGHALPVPSTFQHRSLWCLPKSGIVTVQRAQLLKTPKPSAHVVSSLVKSLDEARKLDLSARNAVNRLREILDEQPQYREMGAEQAIKVLEQVFADDHETIILAAAVLYKVSPEPHRFLLQLADHTAASLVGPGTGYDCKSTGHACIYDTTVALTIELTFENVQASRESHGLNISHLTILKSNTRLLCRVRNRLTVLHLVFFGTTEGAV